MDRNNICILCSEGLDDGEVVKVTRGLPAIISASKELNDGKVETLSRSNCPATLGIQIPDPQV